MSVKVYYRVERKQGKGWVKTSFVRYAELVEAQEFINEDDRPDREYRIVRVTEEVVQ